MAPSVVFRLRALLVLALCVLSSCAGGAPASGPAATGGPRAPEVRFQISNLELKSGLRIIIEEDHAAPVAGVVAFFGSGSAQDPPGKEGLAHLVEHLTFQAKHTPGRTVWSLLEQAGAGAWNAGTSFDYTKYHAFGPRDALGDLFSIETLLFDDPLVGVDDAAFAIERDVVRNELRTRNEMDFNGQVLGELQRATFPPEHPYARPIVGTHASLDSLTLEDARAFVKAHYRPENATIVILGDVDAKRASAMISERLPPSLAAESPSSARARERAPRARLPAVAPAVPAPPPAAGLRTVEGHVGAPELWVAWSAPRAFDTEGYLNSFAGSALWRALYAAEHEDNDISRVSVVSFPGALASMLLCRVMLVDGKHPEESLEHVLNQLARAGGASTSQEQVRDEALVVRSKKALATRLLFEAEDEVERASRRAAFAHFSGDTATFQTNLRAIENVTPAIVADFEQAWVTRARARALLVRPMKGAGETAANTELRVERTKGDENVTFDVASIPAIAVPVGTSAFRSVTLPNGLPVVIARRDDLPIATVALAFHDGTATSEPRSAAELVRDAASWGDTGDFRYLQFGALAQTELTTEEYTLTLQLPSAALEDVLGLLHDHVTSLDVTTERLKRYRLRTLPRRRLVEARPEAAADRQFVSALGGDARGVDGADADKLEAADLRAWIGRTFVPNNATLVISGNVDVERTLALVHRSFDRWSGAGPQRGVAAAFARPITRRVVTTVVPGTTLASVRLGCVLPQPDPQHDVTNRLVASIVVQRLERALRGELGATYFVLGGVTNRRSGSSELVVRSAIENGKLGAALRVIRKTVDADPASVVNAASLDQARWDAAIRFDLGLATNEDVVRAILRATSAGWPLASIDETPRTLASATPAPLAEALAACERGLVLSVAGEDATVRAALHDGWP